MENIEDLCYKVNPTIDECKTIFWILNKSVEYKYDFLYNLNVNRMNEYSKAVLKALIDHYEMYSLYEYLPEIKNAKPLEFKAILGNSMFRYDYLERMNIYL